MKKRQVPAGRFVLLLLLSLALFALSLAVAEVHESAAIHQDPSEGSTVAGPPTHVTSQFGEELDTTDSGAIWMVEALAGVLVVLSLSEALRRRYSERSVPDREMNSSP
jgi:hypothetical protein